MKEYLPIGSVVTLIGSKRKIMINGFHVYVEDFEDAMDYRGSFYPMGMRYNEDVIVFNHEQIEDIVFRGFDSDEEKEFKSRLKEAIKKEEGK